MLIELRDRLDNLFADAQVSRTPCRSMVLDVARGGTAAVHVLLDGLEPGLEIRFAATERGRTVRAAHWFRLVDVPVEENTGRIGLTVSSRRWKEENACNPYVVRQAPFRTFDAMAPVHGAVAATGTTAALRLEVAMPLDARPGSRRLALMVRQGAQCAELQLRRRR